MDASKAFEQLTALTGDGNYHLLTLNFPEKVELGVFRELSAMLDTPAQVRVLLESGSWREQLIAYMAVMASRSHSHLEQLKQCFRAGSFISPQLAVAISLQTKRQGLNFFVGALEESEGLSSKALGAIVACLPICGAIKVSVPALQLDPGEFRVGFESAVNHLSFWQRNGWQ
jgi:hypothetical protein